MKKTMLLPLISCAFMALTGCKNKEEKKDVYIFAAASMTETLNQIKTKYMEAHQDVNLLFNFKGSGDLQTQIEQGADCDLFISAAPKQMNNLQNENLIDVSTRINLLENKVVLATTQENPSNVTGFQNTVDRILADESGFVVAVGEFPNKVPAGEYANKIYQSLDLTINDHTGHFTKESDVKGVTAKVSNGGAACGVIYATDAYSAGLKTIETATKEQCGGQVIYPAAVTANAKQADLAKAFLEYLQGSEAKAIFESVGFTALN